MIGSMHASRSRRSGWAQDWARVCALAALCVGLSALFVGLSAGLIGLTAGASAQDDNASDWGGGPVNESPSQCTPKCRRGFECHRGECQPICSPACGPGFLCTSNGTCVRTDAPEPVQQSSNSGWGAGGQQCLPSCRSGYLCVSGQCVSA